MRSNGNRLGNPNRDPEIDTKDFANVLNAMERAQLIVQNISAQRGFSSTIKAGPRLLKAMRRAKWGPDQLTHLPRVLVRLRAPKREGEVRGQTRRHLRSAEPEGLRERANIIFEWYDTHDLRILRAEEIGLNMEKLTLSPALIHSNDGWEQGGRWYDWFTNFPSAELWRIWLDGEPCAMVDYDALHPRLAYAHVGAPMAPNVDPYNIPGLEGGERKGRKQLLNAMLNTSKPLRAWPKKADREGRTLESRFPPGMKISEAVNLVKRAHPALVPLFEKGVGLRLQHVEREIMLTVMEACKGAKLPARWRHDAIMVPVSRRKDAARIMLDCFRKHCGGADCGVTSELLVRGDMKELLGKASLVLHVGKEHFVFVKGKSKPHWESKSGPSRTFFRMPDGERCQWPTPPRPSERGMPYAPAWAKYCEEMVEVATRGDPLMLELYGYFEGRLRGMGKSWPDISLTLIYRVRQALLDKTPLTIILPGEAVVVGVLP